MKRRQKEGKGEREGRWEAGRNGGRIREKESKGFMFCV